MGDYMPLLLGVSAKTKFALFTAALVTLGACNTSNNMLKQTSSPNNSPNPATAFQLFTDIPVPPGTSFDAENSLILGSGEGWTGRLIIKLGNSPSESFAIYTTEMPQFGWKPIASVQSGTSVLTFTRGDRAATIEIESRSIAGSLVRITMTPQAANTP